MRQSLINAAVDTVAGAVETTADTLTGTTATSVGVEPSSESSDSSTDTTTPSTPTPTISTPTATTAAPITATPSSIASTNSSSSGSFSSAMEGSSSFADASASAANSDTIDRSSAWSQSNSNYPQLDDSTSSSQDVGSVDTDYEDRGLSSGCIVASAVSALGLVLLLAMLIFRSYRQRRACKLSLTLSGHHNAPALENPLSANTGDPQLFATSSTGLFSVFRTTNLDNSNPSSSLSPPTDLWEDAAITATRIPLEKLIQHKLVNSGGHGEVHRGLYRGESVAIKMLLPEKRKDLNQINIFLAEIKIMASVEHPRIVRFIGVAWDSLTDLCAVSEFMEGGDLFSLLRRFERVEHRSPGFDVDKARIALHVAHSLTYLHSLDPVILHRDLKSMNILLTSDLEAKITDFGVSRKWTVDTMTAGVGTRLWMAPEVMLGKRYDTSADIFSFGIVLSELDSHLPPYAEVRSSVSMRKISDTALLQMVSSGGLRVEFSPNVPRPLVHLGHACVDLDPSARPSAGELLYQLQLIMRMYEEYTV